MTATSEPPHDQPSNAALRIAVEDTQAGWPAALRFKTNGASVYFHFPSFLIGAFRHLTPEGSMPLCAFCRIYAESIFWQDKIIDGTPIEEPPATIALRVMLMQAEAYQLLHQMFVPDARFWLRFREYLLEHANACLLERQFATGQRPLHECTDVVRHQIVLGKNGLARTIVAGLVEMSGDEHLYAPLIDVTNEFNKATQLWDDIEDWRDDLRRGIPTAVVCRLVTEIPKGLDNESWETLVAHLSREFYYRGHLQELLSMIVASLNATERHAEALPRLGLYRTIRALRRRCEVLGTDVMQIMRRNVALARNASSPR
jgi:hypothetical protein